MKKPNALFIYVGRGPFVTKDIEIFTSFFSLKEFNFVPGKKWKTPLQLINQFLFLIANIWSCKIIIIQLSGFHAFFPTLLARITGKKSLIIAAGTDCHSFPSIGYGNYQKKILAYFTRLSFKLCTHIVPKHETLWFCDYTYSEKDYTHQGIKFFNPSLNKPHTVIENGFDPSVFKSTNTRKSGTFLGVAGGMNFPFQKQLKGIDLIFEVSKYFPENLFTIVGIDSRQQTVEAGSNIKLIPPVANKDLPEIFSSHQFFFQLSMAEGFPNSLCEAMLCECIPIGSDVFSIPEIIGSTGYLLKKRDVLGLKQLIEKALSQRNNEMGGHARKHIIDNYTLEKRKLKFIKLFNDLGIHLSAEY